MYHVTPNPLRLYFALPSAIKQLDQLQIKTIVFDKRSSKSPPSGTSVFWGIIRGQSITPTFSPIRTRDKMGINSSKMEEVSLR